MIAEGWKLIQHLQEAHQVVTTYGLEKDYGKLHELDHRFGVEHTHLKEVLPWPGRR